jgi:putative acetyltransferase
LPYPSREQWRQRLAEPSEGTYDLVAVADGSVVGMVSEHTFPDLPWRRHVGAIDIVVRAGWQGKGLGKALMHARLDLADARLDPTRLELEVYTDNEAAVRLYERLGFELEGTL